ncbi:MAG: hypothetical protein ABJJ05_07450 [Maribacter litoralis]|uniref:hypothetical protein n=1 Tax=Maribacter litoralis TaxID=2059726 RepID=UPI0032991F7F
MVLKEDFAVRKIGESKEFENLGIMFLNVEHIDFHDDLLKMEWGINLMNNVTKAKWANDFFKEMGCNKIIDCSILYDGIKAVFNDEPFKDQQLKKYYEFLRCMEQFNFAVRKLHSVETPLPTNMELFLLGLPAYVFSDKVELDKISTYYHNIYVDYVEKQIEQPDFIKSAKELVSVYKK